MRLYGEAGELGRFRWNHYPSANPLDALAAEHILLRSVGAMLSDVVDNFDRMPVHEDARAILEFLTERMPLQVALKESILFDMLLKDGSDAGARLCDRVASGHRSIAYLAVSIVGGLYRLANGGKPRDPKAFRRDARAFVAHQNSVADWEDEILRPYVWHLAETENLSLRPDARVH